MENGSRNLSKTVGDASLRIWRLTGADPGGSGASRTGGNDMAEGYQQRHDNDTGIKSNYAKRLCTHLGTSNSKPHVYRRDARYASTSVQPSANR